MAAVRWRNTRQRWGLVAQLLHWLIALAVFGQIALGWVMVNYPISPAKFELYSLHKSLGVTVWLAVLVRLGWRALNPTPSPPARPAWEGRAATATHWALYALLLLMPLSGYLINSAANFPLLIWGLLPLPNLTGESEGLQELAELVHLALFWLLAALLTLHVAAALRHHFLLRDDVLRRMLPGSQSGEPR